MFAQNLNIRKMFTILKPTFADIQEVCLGKHCDRSQYNDGLPVTVLNVICN